MDYSFQQDWSFEIKVQTSNRSIKTSKGQSDFKIGVLKSQMNHMLLCMLGIKPHIV